MSLTWLALRKCPLRSSRDLLQKSWIAKTTVPLEKPELVSQRTITEERTVSVTDETLKQGEGSIPLDNVMTHWRGREFDCFHLLG